MNLEKLAEEIVDKLRDERGGLLDASFILLRKIQVQVYDLIINAVQV